MESCPTYPADARVTVHPFEKRKDGDDVVIGSYERSSFLCVPAEGLDFLELLADGRTIGEAREEYRRTHGAETDLDDFLDVLREEGFVNLAGDLELEYANPVARRPAPRRYHFDTLPVSVARTLCSPAVLVFCGSLVSLGAIACVIDPGILPSPSALVFQTHDLWLIGALLALMFGTLFLHELAHLVAARAAGVPSRLGIGSRLWILVAETDMSGVWLASRRQRCLAFLAGPLFDLTTAAGLALLLFATRHGLLQVDQAVIALVRASLFIALARLLWQTYFFVPTDLYYVIGTLFGCKNLMQDTQTFVLNGLARVLTWLPARDQSAIPTRELRVVRWFAIVWLGGRAIAFASLFWITLPILTGYGAMLVRSLAGDAAAARRLEEGSVMPLVAVALQAVGLLIWSGSLVRRRLRSRRVIG